MGLGGALEHGQDIRDIIRESRRRKKIRIRVIIGIIVVLSSGVIAYFFLF